MVICTKLDEGILISLSLAEWMHQIIVGAGGSWKLRDKQRTQRVMKRIRIDLRKSLTIANSKRIIMSDTIS